MIVVMCLALMFVVEILMRVVDMVQRSVVVSVTVRAAEMIESTGQVVVIVRDVEMVVFMDDRVVPVRLPGQLRFVIAHGQNPPFPFHLLYPCWEASNSARRWVGCRRWARCRA